MNPDKKKNNNKSEQSKNDLYGCPHFTLNIYYFKFKQFYYGGAVNVILLKS